jgi:hypothetical protein
MRVSLCAEPWQHACKRKTRRPTRLEHGAARGAVRARGTHDGHGALHGSSQQRHGAVHLGEPDRLGRVRAGCRHARRVHAHRAVQVRQDGAGQAHLDVAALQRSAAAAATALEGLRSRAATGPQLQAQRVRARQCDAPAAGCMRDGAVGVALLLLRQRTCVCATMHAPCNTPKYSPMSLHSRRYVATPCHTRCRQHCCMCVTSRATMP